MSFVSYSQSLKLINSDTLICFSIPQGKYLLKQVNTAKFFVLQDSISKVIIDQKDLLINTKNLQIKNLENIQRLNDSLNHVCELKTEALTVYNDNLVRQFRKEKRAKIIALLGGVISTSVLATLYIIK